MNIQISRLTADEIDTRGISGWPIWTCGVSEFDWEYGEQESCLVLEGEVEVTAADEVVHFGTGDYVVFPQGLSCRWKVIKPVKKHYHIG